jgi:hypothetical protein
VSAGPVLLKNGESVVSRRNSQIERTTDGWRAKLPNWAVQLFTHFRDLRSAKRSLPAMVSPALDGSFHVSLCLVQPSLID